MRFTIRAIGGVQPKAVLRIANGDPIKSQPGEDYDQKDFVIDTGPLGPASYLFSISIETMQGEQGNSVIGNFSPEFSGSKDVGIDVGEGAANPDSYLLAWRNGGKAKQYGKPTGLVSDWNGYLSQEFSGADGGAYQARFVLNGQCGLPIPLINGVLGVYSDATARARLGAPRAAEREADRSLYPEWAAETDHKVGEFTHGFVGRLAGTTTYEAFDYPPSVGEVSVAGVDVGNNQVALRFRARVNAGPGMQGSREPLTVAAYWYVSGAEPLRSLPMTALGNGIYEGSVSNQDAFITQGSSVRFYVEATRASLWRGSFPQFFVDSAAVNNKNYADIINVSPGLLTNNLGTVQPEPATLGCDIRPPSPPPPPPPVDYPPTLDVPTYWQDGQGNLVVRVRATDDKPGLKVSLSSEVGEQVDTLMQLWPSAGPDFYEAIIRGRKPGETVKFTVRATDSIGQTVARDQSGKAVFSEAFGQSCHAQCKTGNPINTATGNDTDTYTDIFVEGRGESDIAIQRTTNSQDERIGPFGIGSSFNYDIALSVVDNMLLRGAQLRYGDGRTANFRREADGSFTPISPGNFDTLRAEGGGFVLRQKDRTTYTFNSTGKLVAISDRNGVATTLEYDGAGKLARISNASGRVVTVQWAGGLISMIVAPEGKQLQYGYTGNRLTSFTNARGFTMTYQRDAAGRVIGEFTPNGYPHARQEFDDRGRALWQIVGTSERRDFTYDDATRTTTVRDANNFIITYIYDQQYQITEINDARSHSEYFTYDSRGNLRERKDRRGHVWRYDYDINGNRIEQRDPIDGYSSKFYGEDITTWTYNANDLLSVTDALKQTTRYDYDDRGNLLHTYLPDGAIITTTYDLYGEPLTITDGRGNTTVNAYDSVTGDLTSVTDAEGNSTRFGYDGLGRQTSVTDPNNHTVTMRYDGNDNVTDVVDAKGKANRFIYDPNDNLTDTYDRRDGHTHHEYDTSDQIVLTIDPADARTAYAYEPMGHTSLITNARGFTTHYFYDPNYNVSSMQDTGGAWWYSSYDENNNRIRQLGPHDVSTDSVYDAVNRLKLETDANRNQTEYCYNALDQVIQIFNARRAQTVFDYDQVGRLAQIKDALGALTRWRYDLAGNVIAEINGENETTRYGYDRANRRFLVTNPLTQTISTELDGVGNVLRVIDARGNPTAYGYDANNNLQVVTNTLSMTVTFGYNAEDERTLVRDPEGSTSSFEYNADGTLKTATQPGGGATSYQYDPNKNLIALTNALGKITTITYDQRDQQASETDPLGSTTTLVHNALGWLTAKTDAENKTYQYAYDQTGQLIQVIDPISGETTFEHDAVGNTTLITFSNGMTTTFEFNFLNQLTREVDALNQTMRYDYDRAGRLIRRVDGEWRATNYDYDPAGRLITTRFGDGKSVAFEYDPNGNETAMRDWNGLLTRTFDPLNRPITVTDSLSHTLAYSWNDDGTRASRTYPNGTVITSTYDLDNRLSQLALPGGASADYRYDPLGYMTALQYTNGISTTFGYDAASRLTSLKTSAPNNRPIAWYDFMLDKVGNRVQTAEQRIFAQPGATQSLTTTYTYDDLYRLIGEAQANIQPAAGQTTNWRYDGVGNWLERSVIAASNPVTTTTAYTHTAVSALKQAGSWQYEQDRNGNRITATAPITATEYAALKNSFPQATVVITYAYDFENRLASSVETIRYRAGNQSRERTAQAISYTYDGLGRRLRSVITTSVTTTSILARPTTTSRDYVYDGLDIAADYETKDAGVAVATNYYRANGRMVAQERNPGKSSAALRFFHHDGLGSTVALTDKNGKLASAYRYDAYGKPLAGDMAQTRMTYTGQEWDAETSTYHYYARSYDPANGVWLQRDSYRGSVSDPLSMARYSFVLSNPTSMIDLLGFKTFYVHGTFASSPEKDTTDYNFVKKFAKNMWGDNDVNMHSWNSWYNTNPNANNDPISRTLGAVELANKIQAYRLENPNECINLMGHSHGGTL